MSISLIVAMAENRVIGRNGQLPWRLPADLRRFKQLTMGHHLIMGRKTFDSIGRLLPGRTSIIVTRQRHYDVPGGLVANSLEEALELSAGDSEVFIIGGAELYQQALPLVQRMYVTLVHAAIPGDVHFVDYDPADWRLVLNEPQQSDEKNPYRHTFQVFDRVTSNLEFPSPLPFTSPRRTNTMSDTTVRELLDLTQRLLNSIVTGDWQTYITLCDPSLTCFEPEARGQLVEGLQFHQFYFELGGGGGRRQITITQPHVRLLGDDAAVVNYVRLTQSADASGAAATSRYEETRIWQRQDGQWRHVHFHRSANS